MQQVKPPGWDRPGEEFYQLGKEREKAGDLVGAVSFYKKAERLGHPLCEAEIERYDGYCPPEYEVPKDPEDPSFLLSFHLHQEKEIQEFFDKFGFVIIRDVLNESDCKATVDEIWDYIEQHGFVPDEAREKEKETFSKKSYCAKRNDPSTWIDFRSWPPLQNEGIVGSRVVWWPQALRNRQNPNVHKAFSIIFGRVDLMINHDRYGLFRPTKDVPYPVNSLTDEGIYDDDDEVADDRQSTEKEPIEIAPRDIPKWRTTRNCHFDMNPWKYVEHDSSAESDEILSELRYECESDFITENNEVGVLKEHRLHVQALINLIDNRVADGGFHIVPGFKHHIVEWVEDTKNTLKYRYGEGQTFIVLPKEEPLQGYAVRVTARAGSLVIWDQRTVHGSAPNYSSNFRAAQFLKMFPAIDLNSDRAIARAAVVRKRLKERQFDAELTDLGSKLFGLSAWDTTTTKD